MVAYAWELDDPDHPRPPEVARVEAFLNTVDEHRYGEHARKPEQERDLLTGPAALQAWLSRHGLDAYARGIDVEDVQRVRRLRDVLRGWLRARQGLDDDALQAVAADAVLTEMSCGFALARPGILVPKSTGAGGAMEQLLIDIARAEAAGTLPRLKMCRADDCGFVFYDHSRSRTSKWCSMQTCGNRHKTRRYRQRRTG